MIDGDLPMEDARGDGKRELDDLPFGLVNHLFAQRSELFERLRQPPQHRFSANRCRFLTGALSLRVPFRERLPFDVRQPALIHFGMGQRVERRWRRDEVRVRLGGASAPIEWLDLGRHPHALRSKGHRALQLRSPS